MIAPNHFNPRWPLKNGFLQTALSSSRLRVPRHLAVCAAAREVIFECNQGVRLLGFHSLCPATPSARAPKGLAILLHGWEGSSESTYLLRTAQVLFGAGYDVLRLNFRDHGPSHHLNEGLFYAVLLQEVLDAVAQAADLVRAGAAHLIGFSLGGNFSLRIARQARALPKLASIAAISPVLDPDQATDRIDGHGLIRRYFLNKWRRSLIRKQELYPHLYAFGEILKLPDLRTTTEALLADHSDYDSAVTYFKDYAIGPDDLRQVAVPTVILTAQDDPIIPADDFKALAPNPMVRVAVQQYGGHNGFLCGLGLQSWYERELPGWLADPQPVSTGP